MMSEVSGAEPEPSRGCAVMAGPLRRIMIVPLALGASGTAAAMSGCVPDPLPPVEVLAVAYTNVDGVDGYGPGDAAIAKLEDTNRDGAASTGDRIVMGQYPLDFAADDFGDFVVASHTVGDVVLWGSGAVAVTDTSKRLFVWNAPETGAELYQEVGLPPTPGSDAPEALVLDAHGFPAQFDRIVISPGSPSLPGEAVDKSSTVAGDADTGFVDVDVAT